MPEFIPGLKLNELFYFEVVKPILAAEFPSLVYSAARLGTGSDVLGYDDEISTDHDWGLRFQLFLSEEDEARWETAVAQTLAHQLPVSFRGYSTHFDATDEEGVSRLEPIASGPVNHRITTTTIRRFFHERMRFDPFAEPSVYDWLTFAQQHLLEVTRGAVFHDGLGDLEPIRDKLAYFPHDVWLYLLAAQWARIGQEEHFMGRAGDAGDELGSQLLAARLVHDIMLLCFLMERQYAPYPKWFGAAASRLECAPRLMPILQRVLTAATWQEREIPLCEAFKLAAKKHNQLGITEALDTAVSHFHGRPYKVIHADRFVTAIKNVIADETVKAIPTNIGSIDQFSHSADLREQARLHRRLATLYIQLPTEKIL
ncbi:MAG: DUF4037 domain-containing protein [Chloroflexi bacterium]|nr:DUF4037 domain-containing protein [Chloroflexota bacterium]